MFRVDDTLAIDASRVVYAQIESTLYPYPNKVCYHIVVCFGPGLVAKSDRFLTESEAQAVLGRLSAFRRLDR